MTDLLEELTPHLVELKKSAELLLDLLKSPEPGLWSWWDGIRVACDRMDVSIRNARGAAPRRMDPGEHLAQALKTEKT